MDPQTKTIMFIKCAIGVMIASVILSSHPHGVRYATMFKVVVVKTMPPPNTKNVGAPLYRQSSSELYCKPTFGHKIRSKWKLIFQRHFFLFTYIPITIAMQTDIVTMFGKIASLCRLFRASQVSSLYLKEYFMFCLIWLYHTWSFNLCTCQGSQWTPVQKSLFFLRYSLIFLQYLFWKYAIRC